MSAFTFPSLSIVEPPAPARGAVGPPPADAEALHPDALLRVFRSGSGTHLFVADGSRIYDLDDDTAEAVSRWLSAGGDAPPAVAPVLDLLPGNGRTPRVGVEPLRPPS